MMATSYTYASPEQMLKLQQMLGNPAHVALTASMVAQETGLSQDSAVAALKRAEADGVAVELEQAGWYTAPRPFPRYCLSQQEPARQAATTQQMAAIQQLMQGRMITARDVPAQTGLSYESAKAALERMVRDGVAREAFVTGWYEQVPAEAEQLALPVEERRVPTTAAGRIAARMAYVGGHTVVGMPKLKPPSVGNHPGLFIILVLFVWALIMVIPVVIQFIILIVAELVLGVAWLVVAPFSAVSLMRRR